MTSYSDLTDNQRILFDEIEQAAVRTGADTRLLLLEAIAPAGDKAAVAEVLGGPGAGAEFLR